MCGKEVQKIVDTQFTYDDSHKKTMANIISDLNEYFAPKKNTLLSRHKLLLRKQERHETYAEYVMALKALAAQATLSDETEETRIRDLFIFGINSVDLKRKLLTLDSDATLKMCLILCVPMNQLKTI